MTISMKSISEFTTRMITPKKVEKAAAEVASKEGKEAALAIGQDARSIQGKAMLKAYEKPEMKEVKLKKENTKAASGEGWDKGGEDDYGTGGDLDSDFGSGSNSIWDSGW